MMYDSKIFADDLSLSAETISHFSHWALWFAHGGSTTPVSKSIILYYLPVWSLALHCGIVFLSTQTLLDPGCFYGYVFCLFVEVEINKLRTEEAGLRDALLKMQALNEGLGQDKIELNRIIMHLEQEKATLQVCNIFYMLTYLRQQCQSYTKVLNYRTSYKQ